MSGFPAHIASFFVFCLFILAGSASAAPAGAADGFLLLPGAEFQMGSSDSERLREADEVLHTVRISPFFVDPYEVTQEDYETVMGSNPSAHRGKRLPVENVTWLDAVKYCNALSVKKGLEPVYTITGEAVAWNRKAGGYRLLTEAEWEYAARAGTKTIFNVGNQVSGDDVNFEGTYPYLIEENYVNQKDPSVRAGRYRGQTIAVDANDARVRIVYGSVGVELRYSELEKLGDTFEEVYARIAAILNYHTHGNVSEWVFDYYGPYDTQKTSDPAGPESGTYRVNRGGSYLDFGKHLRSAYRSATNPVDPDPNLGFRICRNAQPLDAVVATAAPFRIAMPAHPRVLVAYFSYSGNTKHAAELLSKNLGCDLFPITMKHPYQGNIYRVSQEDLYKGYRPPLVRSAPDMSRYDVILLGYPTWWATMPMPVLSFLESADMRGKIILPFSSHGGTVFGDSVSDLSKAVPGAYVGIGFEFNYSGGFRLESHLNDWLRESGIRK